MEETQHCEHGVFLSVFDVGLLIKGKPGIGKSTVALELIEKGHDFICDDIVHVSVEINDEDPQHSRLIGKSPRILRDLLSVRDMGVINIQQLFPATNCMTHYQIDLIIELVDKKQPFQATLTGIQSVISILNHSLPVQFIHASPERNLALIVETAVKNYILYRNQQDAATLLEQRQQEIIISKS